MFCFDHFFFNFPLLSKCSLLICSWVLFLSAFLWQLMRCNILQLLKNLRGHSQGKEMTDADILNWANAKVKKSGRTSQMDSFKVWHLSFLPLFSSCSSNIMILLNLFFFFDSGSELVKWKIFPRASQYCKT